MHYAFCKVMKLLVIEVEIERDLKGKFPPFLKVMSSFITLSGSPLLYNAASQNTTGLFIIFRID